MTASRQCPSCARSFPADVAFCPQDGSATREAGSSPPGRDPFVGAVLVGHIEVRRLVGVGAMASVYLAHQRGLDRDVAVKILSEDAAADPDLRARLFREAQLAAKVVHPHVVQVLLACEVAPLDGGPSRPALVMELVDGLSLRAAREGAGGKLPLARVLHIGLALADALGEAHALGVIHRDVKPENVMLTARRDDADHVKVLDFGLARAVSGEMTDATRRGAVFGTPRYLSPEAAVGASVGPEADVYAAGAVMFELLTGEAPFERGSAVAYLVAHATEAPRALRSLEAGRAVPDPVAAVIDACLVKEPSLRPPDGRALAKALRAAMREAGVADARGEMPQLPTVKVAAAATQVSGASTLAVDGPAPASTRVPTLIDDVSPLDLPTPSRPPPPVTSGASQPGPTPTLVDSPPPRWRSVALVLGSFVLGAVIVGGLTLSSRRPSAPPISPADALLAEAREAVEARAWDEPPGRNARDLLVRGRAAYPADTRFLDAARRASIEATADAVRARQEGAIDRADRLSRAALAMDPDNGVAATMIRDLQAKEPLPPPPSTAKRPGGPPPAATRPGSTHSGPGKDPGEPPPDGGRWM